MPTNETPLFFSVAYAHLFAWDAELDAKINDLHGLSDEDFAAVELDFDHALFAFEGLHPHFKLELQWAGQAERDFMESFDNWPSDR